jgi:hypothetical protein
MRKARKNVATIGNLAEIHKGSLPNKVLVLVVTNNWLRKVVPALN